MVKSVHLSIRFRVLALLFFAAPLLPGCIYSREIAYTRRSIEREIPGSEFERKIVFSLGPAAIHLARWITRLADDPDAHNAASYMRDLRRVKVGIYRTESFPDLRDSTMPNRMKRALHRDGWELATQVIEENSIVWVFYQERRGTVRDLLVVVVDGDEMVIARVRGRLDRIMEQALEDYGPDEWS